MNTWLSLSASDIWALLIQQSAQVTVLIVCVLGLVRLCAKNRPHLAHALWGLVLLKCLTPPIFALPLSPFCLLQPASEAAATRPTEPVQIAQRATLTEVAPQQKSTSRPRAHDFRTPSSWHPSKDAFTASSSPPSIAPVNDVLTSNSTVGESRGPRFVQWAVAAWAISAGVCLLVAAMRLSWFLRNVRKARVEPNASTQQILRQLLRDLPKRRFSFRRRVRVVVVDSLIGPAVVGILRPRILLPRVLESECTAGELRILLGHELTHIRRGDLWWALLQTIACCLWWFHPLVHWVSRWFDRVTELSCDEETVASLHCQPAEYARSLLSVLERKHLLYSAPALPGVRPVELTAKRMERIMQLSHNAKASRPWWVRLVMLFGALALLPGAAWSVASEQDLPQPNKYRVEQAPLASSPTLPETAQPKPAVKATPFIKTYEPRLALRRIKQDESCDDAQAKMILQSWLLNNLQLNRVRGTNNDNSTGVVVSSSRIIVRGYESSHQRVEKELSRIEKHGFRKQVVIDTRFISIGSTQFNELPFDWKLLPQTQAGVPILLRQMSPAETRSLVEAVQADERANVLHAPRCTCFNGQEIDISDITQRPFVVGFNHRAGAEDEAEIRIEKNGVELTFCPVAEDRFVSLDVQYCRSTITDVSSFSFQSSGETKTVQVPKVLKQQFHNQISFPAGHSLAYAMPDSSDENKVSLVIVTATPASQADNTAKQNASAIAPTPTASGDFVYYGTRPVVYEKDRGAKAESEVKVESIVIKADGPRMSEDDIRALTEAIGKFGWTPHLEGTFEYEIADEKVVLKGKNIALSADRDDPQLTSPGGVLTLDTANKTMHFRADTNFDFVMDDSVLRVSGIELLLGEAGLQVSGAPLRFELKEYALRGECEKLTYTDKLQFSGNVQLQKGDTQLAADRVSLEDFESSHLQLRGNVSLSRHRPKTDKAATTINAPQLKYDLETDSVDFE
ncbi:M56 family metallopeptidase [Roseimaritima ulvae]|uniref:Methicillin resistance mecR1 protein n=1 Tax=Roseimaritima ulvae TaxID=980254 RepID=A0A5B9QK88_9BACT|nr:M56 family metallopeptidase [Roseimaritima ulvae]QEG39284.1 Methicillin resistance mecR1 protein [Roseimaritima ulvae]